MTKKLKNRPQRIGIFDSGIGGVTVYKEIRRLMGSCEYFYCSDSRNFPYGTKKKSEVIECALNSAKLFHQKFDLDVLVIACNTASTVALQTLRDYFDIQVVGVVPAIKPAAEKSISKVIGLLATPGTIASPYTKDLVSQFAEGFEVITVGSSDLVVMAEDFIAGYEIDVGKLEAILSPILSSFHYNALDQLVLGCTHFPFLKEHLAKILHPGVNFVDSGLAIANRVYKLLDTKGSDSLANESACKVLFTKTSQKEVAQAKFLKAFNMVVDI